MRGNRRAVWASLPFAVGLALALATAESGEGRPDLAAVMKAQRDAMAPLAFLDGVWRGPAWTVLPSGERRNVTQTERVGPFLEGAVKVIEGRGYDTQGAVAFHALGILSYDPGTRAYNLRSYAEGNVGDFRFTPAENGFTWEMPAGPAAIRFTGVVKDGKWHEVGERIVAGREPLRFFEMNLERLGDTTWPAEGAVPTK